MILVAVGADYEQANSSSTCDGDVRTGFYLRCLSRSHQRAHCSRCWQGRWWNSRCRIERTFSCCDWEPTGCFTPNAPFYSIYDVDSFNQAVREYNFFLTEIDVYLDCIVRDAQADISRNFPELVSNSVRQLSSEINSEAENARSQIERSRLYIE